MDPEIILENLAPLREPSAISWWPPAIGWWLVAGVVVAALVSAVLLLRKRRQQSRYRRAALAQFKTLSPASLEAINTLLKAVALRVWPKQQVAALHGPAWRELLASVTSELEPDAFEQLDASYRDPQQLAEPELLAAVETWIKRHKVPRD